MKYHSRRWKNFNTRRRVCCCTCAKAVSGEAPRLKRQGEPSASAAIEAAGQERWVKPNLFFGRAEHPIDGAAVEVSLPNRPGANAEKSEKRFLFFRSNRPDFASTGGG
jgi:hypothetical protein